ncbi:MAG: DUF4399 domain-containing protein [Pseudomonadota bacterium]
MGALWLATALAYGAEKGVHFVEPSDGATLNGEFKVVMGVRGMQVAPAGAVAENSGHHHLLIDAEPIPAGEVVPKSEQHMHFGKGQTETTLKLPPGKHTLTLQFADGSHRSYGEAMRSTITVTVQ